MVFVVGEDTPTMKLVILPVSLVHVSIEIRLVALTVLEVVKPHPLIHCTILIEHDAHATSQSLLQFSFIALSIVENVCSSALVLVIFPLAQVDAKLIGEVVDA